MYWKPVPEDNFLQAWRKEAVIFPKKTPRASDREEEKKKKGNQRKHLNDKSWEASHILP